MIPLFLSVRLGSSRLPAKCLLPLADGNSTLTHTVLRAQHFGFDPIVCVPHCDENILRNHLNKIKIKIFSGPLENKLKRWFLAGQFYQIEKFHAVDVDDPYFCDEQVKKNFSKLSSRRDITIFPSAFSDSGGATDGYSFWTQRLAEFAKLPDDFDSTYVPSHIPKHHFVRNKNPDYKHRICRLTLDYIEDYRYIYSLSEGYDYTVARSALQHHIDKNELYDNVYLNERWKSRQLEE